MTKRLDLHQTMGSGVARKNNLSFRWRGFFLEIRQTPSWQWQAFCLGTMLMVGVILTAVVLMLSGVPLSDLFQEFFSEVFLTKEGWQNVITSTGPLLMVGLAASIAFSVRFWNLGLEGQIVMGAIAATSVSLSHLGPDNAFRLVMMALAAMVAGAMWSGIALLLKVRFRVNEMIATLMMNYLATLFLFHLLFGAWVNPQDGMPHTTSFQLWERLPIYHGVSSFIFFAVIATGIVAWLRTKTRLGFYIRVTSANPEAAKLAGLPTGKTVFGAVMASGLLAGLCGMLIITSSEGRLTQDFYNGYGFSGVLIAFLSVNRPATILIVSFLMSVLYIGMQSLQVFYQIPFATVQFSQALIVLCVASAEFFIRHRIRRGGQ